MTALEVNDSQLLPFRYLNKLLASNLFFERNFLLMSVFACRFLTEILKLPLILIRRVVEQ